MREKEGGNTVVNDKANCWNTGCSGYMAQPIESQKEV